MLIKKTINKNDLIIILSNYNLGELKHTKAFKHGSVQKNMLLQTSKGKFVLRIFNNRPDKSTLFEVNLVNYLKSKKFPCPRAVKNKQGKFIGKINNQPYVIFEFAEGKHIAKPTENQKKQLVQKVAEMQNILKNYKPTNIKYRWNYNVNFCKKMAQKKTKKIGTLNAKEKLKWYLAEIKKLELPKSLPKGICHCDFFFGNVLYKNGKFNALIDFDDANYTYKIFDLVALSEPFKKSFTWKNWDKFKSGDIVFDFRNYRKIIETYNKFRPLSKVEKKHLFDVYKMLIMIDCLWYYKRGKASNFFEKRKIEYLDNLGREKFYQKVF